MRKGLRPGGKWSDVRQMRTPRTTDGAKLTEENGAVNSKVGESCRAACASSGDPAGSNAGRPEPPAGALQAEGLLAGPSGVPHHRRTVMARILAALTTS